MTLQTYSTDSLITELCKRDGVVEYLHGEDTYFEIVKFNKPRIINGYKIIDTKSRILVIDPRQEGKVKE